jgi:SAM-dependent MidA family methyltransferase
MSQSIDSRAQPLADRLRDRIKQAGPITFHDWMQAALYDEHDGYYRRADRVRQGRTGDYRTAPETSPLFGATFANYFAKSYLDLGRPTSWTIFEIGAGRGDFAHAFLLRCERFPDVFQATRFLIDEIGDEARRAVEQKLSSFWIELSFDRSPR